MVAKSFKLSAEHIVFGVILAAVWMVSGCGPLSPSMSKVGVANSDKGSVSTPNNNYKVDNELAAQALAQASGAAATQEAIDPNANVRFVMEDSLRVMNQFGETSGWSEMSSSETSSLLETGKVNVNLKGEESLLVYFIVRERSGESKKSLKVFMEKMAARLSSKLTPCIVTKVSEAHRLCSDGSILALLQKDSANGKPKALPTESLSELSERVVRVYFKALE